MSHLAARVSIVLIVILLALLPFHAFLYTWLHSFFWTDGWMIVVQAWKEIIVTCLALIAGIAALREPRKILAPLPLIALAFLTLASVYALIGAGDLSQKVFGLRTIALPWVALVAVFFLNISDEKKGVLTRIAITACGIVVTFALAQRFLLPSDFLAHFGYSTVVSTWLPSGNLPMYHLVGGTDIIRAQSTFAGPNQLAAYLLIVIPLIVAALIRIARQSLGSNFTFKISNIQTIFKAQFFNARTVWLSGCLAASCLTLILTYSRAAWLGLIAMVGIAALIVVWRRWRVRGLITLAIIGMMGVTSLVGIVATHPTLRETITRSASTSEHLTRTIAAARIAATHPLGLGLGSTAGVSQRFDAHETHAGLTPENTFIGIALELGWLGVVLFIALITRLGWELYRVRSPLFFSLIGVTVVMLFLHPLEDAPTALTFVLLAGSAIGSASRATVE